MSHYTLYKQTIENMRREVISSKEKVIHALITKETGSAIIDIEVVKQRGMLEVFPDGSEVFRWDGVPRIVFFPIGITHQGGKAQITQQYQILPIMNGSCGRCIHCVAAADRQNRLECWYGDESRPVEETTRPQWCPLTEQELNDEKIMDKPRIRQITEEVSITPPRIGQGSKT